MAIKRMKGSTPTKRFMSSVTKEEVTTTFPQKPLSSILPKRSGRDNTGRISIRHQAGRHKRLYRRIDFKRDKFGISGVVSSIEYDPNRSTYISLIIYVDGEKRYILSPQGLKIGQVVISDQKVEPRAGNAAPLKNLPVGTVVHNVELRAGSGGKLARSAGSRAVFMALEEGWAHLKLPSREVRKVPEDSLATVGSLSNPDWKNRVLGSAGRKRHLGIKPTVRGVAMSPRDHPHGGGEGRSPIGMPSPKSPWGKPTLGKKTRKKGKLSDRLIIQRRK